MKISQLLISLLLGSVAMANNQASSPKVLKSLDCIVSFGFINNLKVQDMKVTIFAGDVSSTIPEYPKAEVTLSFSGAVKKITMPITNVSTVYAAPPFSKFSVSAYMISWNDGYKSELNLNCQNDSTCTGSGIIQGSPQKVITCEDMVSKQ